MLPVHFQKNVQENKATLTVFAILDAFKVCRYGNIIKVLRYWPCDDSALAQANFTDLDKCLYLENVASDLVHCRLN
ncbi:hypothetical protein Y032_0037g3530 [Ancylostoma ceylanicum]|uniref:Uncharacterized protein n=1 Tax=Ancylostoma ceylanicum TaxID=53326 RepID=A0A016UKK6_9BILA|nr:hypothetical protein Y032_0037g3530 [Ancylostoma ceylanicum]